MPAAFLPPLPAGRAGSRSAMLHWHSIRSPDRAAAHPAAEAILAQSDADVYAAELARVSAIYFERRQALYSAEARWSDHAFWLGQHV